MNHLDISISDRFLFDQPLLLAVSGGLDSMVMAHLFRAAGASVAIAHANFCLRGTASDEDALFVQELAQNWGLPFFVKRFETKTYALEKGISTQMAARELRYNWFHALCLEKGFAGVAVAHHQNDMAETLLLNLVRGKGLHGLKGMSDISQYAPDEQSEKIRVLRPLLGYPRAALEAYAQENGVVWREDDSNNSDLYARNRIRHHVMPVLEEVNPAFLDVAARTAQRVGDTLDNYNFLINNYLGQNNIIEKKRLLLLPSVEQALFALLHPRGFNAEQVRQIAENLNDTGLEIRGESSWRTVIERDRIVLSDQAAPSAFLMHILEDDLMVNLPTGQRLFLMPQAPTPPFPDGISAVLIDFERLVFPLTLKAWQHGDHFQPFGMGGKSQKVQDFLTNNKVEKTEKESILLLLNGDGAVIWVLGHRLDERFKIGATSHKALALRVV